MKKIAVVTSTRAEYGLLSPIIKELRAVETDRFRVELIVSGTHLSEQYGMTVKEIVHDGVRIDHRIPVPVHTASPVDISINQAQVLTRFTELFVSQKYHAVILLGDRYETLAVAIAAVNTRTPIYHISGGDVTEGAIDDCIRHSITKMSYLHFTTNEESRRRVIQLGEDPSRVFNYGSTSIDNVLQAATMTKKEAMKGVGIVNERFAICTYHPVTLDDADRIDTQIASFLDAISAFPDIDFIVTKSNADQGGNAINAALDQAAGRMKNLHVYPSLGVKRYLSLMKYSLFVLGNSSSGIVEAPALHVLTVNIGDRQRGRLQVESILNCQPDTASIVAAMRLALSDEMARRCQTVSSPYGDGNAAPRIAECIIQFVHSDVDLKKHFYDI